jgi:hypothetical protein
MPLIRTYATSEDVETALKRLGELRDQSKSAVIRTLVREAARELPALDADAPKDAANEREG